VRELEVEDHAPGQSGATDAESLARRAATRDEAAWARIFDDHFRDIYAFVRSRLRDPTAAEDLASQVFEVAFSRAETFDYRGLPIQAWLIGIARNLVRDHIKRAIRRGPEEELVETVMPATTGDVAGVELRTDLAAAMRTLTDDQQTVIALRFLLDKPVSETARLMDRSEDAVKTLQRRALAALHRALSAAGYTTAGGGGGG